MSSIYEEMQKPCMILNSLTRQDDSIVLVTNNFDNVNRLILIALLNDGVGMYHMQYITMNVLTSTYVKDSFDNFINKNIVFDNMIFYDKKMSNNMLDTVGVQFPKALTNYHSNTIIYNINKKVNSYDNKSSHNLLKTAGVQFPRGLINYNYNTIIHNTNKKVNSYDNKSSHNLLKTAGVQFPRGLINYNYNTIIHNINKKVNSYEIKKAKIY